MARLWASGAELQSATSGVEWSSTFGTVSISTSTKRSGAAAVRVNPSASTAQSGIEHSYRGVVTGRAFFRAYINIASLPAADCIILAVTDTATYGPYIALHSNGTLQVADVADTLVGSASATLSLGQWYRIELDYDDAAAGNTVNAYLDGTQFCTAANGGDQAGSDAVFCGVWSIPGTAISADVFFDDIAVNDTAAGTGQTGLPGAGSIVCMQPDADGDTKQWQDDASATQGTALVSNINEVTPDDLTNYNKRTTTSPTTTPVDDWNCETSASAGIGSSDTISLVMVGARAGSTATATTGRSIKTRIKSQASGTVLASATTDISLNGWTTHADAIPKPYPLVSYTDPQAGGAWTPALLDTMQIGYQADVSSANEIRVSTIWALVEFVPAVATGGLPFDTRRQRIRPLLLR